MGETVSVDDDSSALAARIDDVLAAHAGDPRAAIETLLLFSDGISESISFGYVRGRLAAPPRSDGEGRQHQCKEPR